MSLVRVCCRFVGLMEKLVAIENHYTMTRSNELNWSESPFKQKKIDHLFHYTTEFERLLKILKNGFSPSYCYENIDEYEYYIPMVSFCNIPITDVQLYMRYGEYGIGINLEWARKQTISPVVYIHDSTPFRGLHRRINQILLNDYVFHSVKRKIEGASTGNEMDDNKDSDFIQKLKYINDQTVPAIQFFKNWKTVHKGVEIITYHEREWRFIPILENNYRLIGSSTLPEFTQLKNDNYKPKPHFPEFSLKFDSIENLRYIIVKDVSEREIAIEKLEHIFGKKALVESILAGKLLIVTSDTVRNDF